jgi:type 1 glutamine amidotransferase
MKILLFILPLYVMGVQAQTPFKILHYTETSGFDHNTRANSLTMFQAMGAVSNFTVDNDNDGSSFNSLSNLQQYAVIVFSNTSGDNILDATQRNNFEAYINGGGSYLGIHAASDTYRHSTANGTNTGIWDWYAEMAGASVQQSPNHVNGTPLYNMYKIGTHVTTDNLPNPWAKNEEYYYWESGYYNPSNIAVLEVEQTIGPNALVNSYDSIRPMAWYKSLPGGGRSFYTALGHDNTNYTSDFTFQYFIRDALLWCAGILISAETFHQDQFKLYPNPANTIINLEGPLSSEINLVNIYGQTVLHQKLNSTFVTLEVDHLVPGIYCLRHDNSDPFFSHKIIIQR